MVRDRGRQRLKNVIVEKDVPAFVREDSVQPDQGGSLTFAAPSELSVLEVNFFELASIKSVAKERHPTRVNVGVILILRTVDEVEIS